MTTTNNSIDNKKKATKTELKKRTKAYIYHRVSGTKQDNEKFSFETKQYCKRLGFRNPILVEEVISATKTKLEKRKIGWILDQENCKHIIVPEQTRLGRSFLDSAKIEAIANERGIVIHCIKEGIVLDPEKPNPDAMTLYGINAVLGRRESAYISIRTKEGVVYARDVLGKRLGKPLDKYTCKLDGHLEEICEMYDNGKTKKEIAEHFDVHPRTLYRFIDRHQNEIDIMCQEGKYGNGPRRRRRGGSGRRRGGNGSRRSRGGRRNAA